jgi:hypothetical protein
MLDGNARFPKLADTLCDNEMYVIYITNEVDTATKHLNCPGRIEAMTPPETQAVQTALWALVENKGQTVLDNLNAQFIEQAIEKLEQRLGS